MSLNHNAIDSLHADLASGKVSALSLIAAIRLHWLNDYLSCEKFSHDHGIPMQHASALISLCRDIHESAIEESI